MPSSSMGQGAPNGAARKPGDGRRSSVMRGSSTRAAESEELSSARHSRDSSVVIVEEDGTDDARHMAQILKDHIDGERWARGDTPEGARRKADETLARRLHEEEKKKRRQSDRLKALRVEAIVKEESDGDDSSQAPSTSVESKDFHRNPEDAESVNVPLRRKTRSMSVSVASQVSSIDTQTDRRRTVIGPSAVTKGGSSKKSEPAATPVRKTFFFKTPDYKKLLKMNKGQWSRRYHMRKENNPDKNVVDYKIDVEVLTRSSEGHAAWDRQWEESGIKSGFPIDYVISTLPRKVTEEFKASTKVLIKYSKYPVPSWEDLNQINKQRCNPADEYQARCYDLDFIEIRLVVVHGQKEFKKRYPNRYLQYEKGKGRGGYITKKRSLYINRLRAIEYRINIICDRFDVPRIYIEDWTNEEEDDENLEKILFTHFLLISAYAEDLLEKHAGNLDHVKCGNDCGTCSKKRKGEDKQCCGVKTTGGYTINYECTDACGCNKKTCTNHDVQRGRQMKLCIFREPGSKGWGVRVMSEIAKGLHVSEYTGKVMKKKRRGDVYDFNLCHDGTDETGEIIDQTLVISAHSSGNESRWFNHACRPNLDVRTTVIERVGIFYHHLSFISFRDILAGEELTFDYFPNIFKPTEGVREMFGPDGCSCDSGIWCRYTAEKMKEELGEQDEEEEEGEQEEEEDEGEEEEEEDDETTNADMDPEDDEETEDSVFGEMPEAEGHGSPDEDAAANESPRRARGSIAEPERKMRRSGEGRRWTEEERADEGEGLWEEVEEGGQRLFKDVKREVISDEEHDLFADMRENATMEDEEERENSEEEEDRFADMRGNVRMDDEEESDENGFNGVVKREDEEVMLWRDDEEEERRDRERTVTISDDEEKAIVVKREVTSDDEERENRPHPTRYGSTSSSSGSSVICIGTNERPIRKKVFIARRSDAANASRRAHDEEEEYREDTASPPSSGPRRRR